MCPLKLSQVVLKDNERFIDELSNFQIDKVIKTIKEKCSSRSEKLNHYRKLSMEKN
jgi:hypothetical protein